MKANRKFVEADDAVSPVIAVILMVAITVVLAATVFVLVSDIGQNTSQQGPQMGWTDDEVDDKWTVTQAPNQVYWEDFSLRGPAGVNYVLTHSEGNSTQAAIAGDVDPDDADPDRIQVSGGDTINFCADTLTSGEVILTHKPTNSVSHRFTFDTIAVCT